MKTIDGHTFNEELLDKGWVIDAGCRGWNFTNELIKTNPVYALDIENFSDKPIGVLFNHAALAAVSGYANAYFFGNGTGNFLEGINGTPGNTEDRPCETKNVRTISLDDIYGDIGFNVDLLKLDIEGSEYEVMLNMEPIPKQITVEFHEHCHEKLHKDKINEVIGRMSKWYTVIQNVGDMQWPRYQYLDCLFIRKDLL